MKKMILGCFLYGTAIGLYAQDPQGDFKGSIQIAVSYTHLTLPTT